MPVKQSQTQILSSLKIVRNNDIFTDQKVLKDGYMCLKSEYSTGKFMLSFPTKGEMHCFSQNGKRYLNVFLSVVQ
jgi:hypothetical protein